MAKNYGKKCLLHLLQVVAGVLCYAFIYSRKDDDFGYIEAFHAYTRNEYTIFRMAEAAKLADYIKSSDLNAARINYFLSSLKATPILEEVSFCFWAFTFMQIISCFPKRTPESGPLQLDRLHAQHLRRTRLTRIVFEYMYHATAAVLYIFSSLHVFIRASNTFHLAAAFGIAAASLHALYWVLLEKEYRERVKEARERTSL